MRPRARTSLLLCALLLSSCGGGDDGVGPSKQVVPTARYAPDPGEILLVVPDSVVLSVSIDPDGPFSAQFLIGDSVVAETPELKVVGERVGQARYQALVNVKIDGENYWYNDFWNVRFVTEIERPTPEPTSLGVSPGSAPGSIAVAWDRPAPYLVDPGAPLEGYEVAWSEAPFTGEEFDYQDKVAVPDNPVGIRQSTEIMGLSEKRPYYVRVRSVDAIGRASFPTVLGETTATGSFALYGHVQSIGPDGWPEPVGSVLVTAGPGRMTTVEDGRFVLENLPDIAPLVLEAEEGSGLYTLPIRTSPLAPVDRELDLVLVPRLNVGVLDDGVVRDISLREFLLAATAHSKLISPQDIRHWPAYPVKVWVFPYTVPEELKLGPDDVHYHDAFATAVERWNDGATGDRRMMQVEIVDPDFDPTTVPGAVGVLFRLYPEAPQYPNLGEVDFIDPAGGIVAEDDPRILRLQLRPNFVTQALAERVIAHELGHALGLVHTPSESNLMHLSSDLAQGVPTPEELFVARFIRYGGPDMMADWIVSQ